MEGGGEGRQHYIFWKLLKDLEVNFRISRLFVGKCSSASALLVCLPIIPDTGTVFVCLFVCLFVFAFFLFSFSPKTTLLIVYFCYVRMYLPDC